MDGLPKTYLVDSTQHIVHQPPASTFFLLNSNILSLGKLLNDSVLMCAEGYLLFELEEMIISPRHIFTPLAGPEWKSVWNKFPLHLPPPSSLHPRMLPFENLTVLEYYSRSNLVLTKSEGAFFSAIFGQKFDLKTVLRPCWPPEWRGRGFITSGCLNNFSDFTPIGPSWYDGPICVKSLKQIFWDTRKLWNPSYAILEVNTVSKQCSDRIFVQKLPRNRLLPFLD